MNNEARQFENTIEDFVKSEKLIEKGELVLAAVSGGQDSMAMLRVLARLKEKMDFSLAVGYFDHMLRPESGKEKKLVEAGARELSLSFHWGEADIRSISQKTGDTLEEAARKARYRFLHEIADRIGASRIATAHTRDDQVETVLMRIIRGTGLRGLAGIPLKRGKLIRPFIHVLRSETERYCKICGIRFAFDSSNLDKRFMRNKIRLELLPLLKSSYHPGVEINLLNLSSNAQTLVSSIKEKISRVLEGGFRKISENEWELDVSGLKDADATSLFILFSEIFGEHMECDMDFTQTHYHNLVSLCKEGGRSGKMLSLPGVTVKREFDHLVFARSTGSKKEEDRDTVELSSLKILKKGIRVPGETRAPGISIAAEIIHLSPGTALDIASTDTTAYFSLDKVTPPIIVRTPEPGDRIRPFGMQGTKKLSDLFIEKKIPSRLRAKALIIADAREIMWVVGVGTSESFRITEETKNILRLSINRE